MNCGYSHCGLRTWLSTSGSSDAARPVSCEATASWAVDKGMCSQQSTKLLPFSLDSCQLPARPWQCNVTAYMAV